MFDFLPHQILEIIRWKMEIFAETRRETDRGRENPYIETFRFKIFRIALYLFIQLQMDIVTS